MEKLPLLNLVIPCYNEGEALPYTKKELDRKMHDLINKKIINAKSKVVLVNDGSKDNTWEEIENMNKTDKMYVGIKLSHNRGHQNALLAGLMYAKDHADIAISMDADLQDDINVMDDMIAKYKEGSDIVYGVRNSRKSDTFFKRFTAEGFYRFMSLMGVDIVFNHADCRLMSRRALEGLAEYQEVNLFLRGIVPQIGYKTDIAYYSRNERVAGESKYPLKKMLSFALEGITSCSVKPLKMITAIGFIILLLSFIILIYSVIMKLIGNTVSGWTFIVCSIWLIGGIQTLCLGIIGEYIGKIYNETKHRPRYIIESILD
ncbi:MAG: glycosyltransferase family 2 protein, partial [Bacilli bacterium]|nr:glycosyltransferase family 2 protein [Bacilli bacterium]MDE6141772.1 glycosyltransferase family 2 protein [Bacilli bacterium]